MELLYWKSYQKFMAQKNNKKNQKTKQKETKNNKKTPIKPIALSTQYGICSLKINHLLMLYHI